MRLNVGDRVEVTFEGRGHWDVVRQRKGTVVYIDEKTYYAHEFSPIQVELDEGYDDTGQLMIRASLKEVTKLGG